MGDARDVVIVGGGIIGCALALALVRRGLAVTVIEPGSPAGEATWAAGGMLSPLGEARDTGPFLALASASLDRYAAWVGELEERSSLPVGYRTAGKLEVALDDEGAQRLRDEFRWRRDAGADVTWLEGREARREEPALSDTVRAAVLISRDHSVDNRALGRAAWVAASRAGARFRLGERAAAVSAEAGRASGVTLSGGDRLAAAHVVVAAGCWSGGLGGLPTPLPVFPIRGQMAAVEAVPPPLRRVVMVPGRVYLVPRASGAVVIGSTMERVGFRKETTLEGVRGLLDAAVRLVPSLDGARFTSAWAGLRPATPDGLPVLGEDPNLPGLFYATGHFRNGVLLAPVTADLLEAAIAADEPPLPLEPFSVGRFR